MAQPERKRAEFLALCDVVALALEELERAGQLDDDRPWLALGVVRRWSQGEATDDEVDEASEQVTEVSAFRDEGASAAAYSAVDWLCLGAQDGSLDDELQGWVLQRSADVLVALGETPEAARSRVDVVHRAGVARAQG
ncbi:MAG: hypothetical protein HY909_00135 [Deltaproteobacteria bacterium]|nr:hypothetical protein [Deltaproteobacteria bacterium]